MSSPSWSFFENLKMLSNGGDFMKKIVIQVVLIIVISIIGFIHAIRSDFFGTMSLLDSGQRKSLFFIAIVGYISCNVGNLVTFILEYKDSKKVLKGV